MKILILLNAILGLIGIYVTYQIRKNKALHKKGERMVCLVGHKCDAVVFSDYSKFLGINLETSGFIYYLYTLILYSIYFFAPNALPEQILFISIGLAFGGFLFSIYLTYIQVFKLKSLCLWCLSSALSSTLIFFSAYSVILISRPDTLLFIEHTANVIKILEFFSLVASIAVFTTLEILVFRFLKDFKITAEENHILKIVSQIGWFMLFLFILNNVGLYLPEYILTGHPISQVAGGKLWIELAVITIIITNTAISSIQILPELKKIGVGEDVQMDFSTAENTNTIPVKRVAMFRKISFLQSVISIVAWYGLFYINFIL